MNNMVERVARAIMAHLDCDLDKVEYYEHAARAAIAAMREPTHEMLNDDCEYCEENSKALWQAMIDAALEEK